MPFDSFCLAAATSHLAAELTGAKVVKIHQPDRYSVVMRLHSQGGSYKLLLSAHPVYGRAHLTNQDYENPMTPPLFCMVLRKHLENSRLTKIQQTPFERVLQLDFEGTDEIGNPTKRRLILEIMGKHSNLILLDAENSLILDGIRRYSHNLSRYREVLPGKAYVAPPPANKTNPDTLDLEKLMELLANQAAEQNSKTQTLLYQTINGVSPFLAQELLTRAGLDPEGTPEAYGEYEYSRLWQALQQLLALQQTGGFQPVLLKNDFGYYDYYALPLESAPPEQQIIYPDLSEALDFYYRIIKDQSTFQGRRQELQKLTAKEEQRLKKKIALQQQDLDQTLHAERFKEAGELLTTYLYLLQKGMKEITLDSFYEPGKTVTITLLPELAPMDNIKRYYRKFNKAKNSQHQIEEQLAANLQELDYMESLTLNLENAETLADLTEIREELAESGYLKNKAALSKKNKNSKKAKEEAEPPRHYTSSDGYTILVGRNNKQNDLLTLKLAGKNDMWLHTQKIPGSHTIIKRQDTEPISDVALLEAAALAAWHSKARHSSQVPVDYTVVSQVKKPNGAKPGMVIYFQQKTLYVTPQDLPTGQGESTIE